MADKIANRLSQKLDQHGRESFINLAFETLLGRSPDDAERAECLEYCGKLAALLKAGNAEQVESRIRARLVHALLNHNDFISIR
jgi:PAS domain-containing protein